MDKEELNEIATPVWDRALEALKRGQLDMGIALIESIPKEGEKVHNRYSEWIWALLTFIGENYGEQEVGRALRYREKLVRQRLELQGGMTRDTVEDQVRSVVETMRSHYSKITVTEEKDRYVIKFQPCGSGGRMLKEAEADPSLRLGFTKEANDWSWTRKGVSYYCAHCCVRELMNSERGVSLQVTDPPASPHDPCHCYVYKSPELVPK
ncbi:MAG: hypothetical protein JSV40_05260 [Deltaproteobacteria bacterium]|nr:MAG: hypothetical protein JSV40_05260 [Deltaproteobacteria bacterium]